MNTESNQGIRVRLKNGNARYRALDDARRIDTAENGQHPYAIVICCSDSRVIPEKIFSVGLGELFVIRVAFFPHGLQDIVRDILNKALSSAG